MRPSRRGATETQRLPPGGSLPIRWGDVCSADAQNDKGGELGIRNEELGIRNWGFTKADLSVRVRERYRSLNAVEGRVAGKGDL